MVQEIFGLTSYVRGVCEYWSARGYDVIAPALFDRVKPGTVLSYDKPQAGRDLVEQITTQQSLLDLEASIKFGLERTQNIALLGYCWGGGLAYRAACEFDVRAAICVYGTRLLAHSNYVPRCPVQLQFAKQDRHASQEIMDAMRVAAPDAEQLVLMANHAFDRSTDTEDARQIQQASRQAIEAFLDRHMLHA